jgi:hypothetical protein
MKKYLLFITIVLTLLFFSGTILLAQQKDYAVFAYNEWKDLAEMEKYIYVIAFQQGIWALTYENEQNQDLDLIKILPTCSNKELVESIDWIYSWPKLRPLSVYIIIVKLEEVLTMRYNYYEQYEKGGL